MRYEIMQDAWTESPKELGKLIKEEFDVTLGIKYKEVSSPKEYNFSDDKFFVTVVGELEKLTKLMKKDVEFLKYIKEITTAYDGYMPYYEYQEVLDDKELCIQTILNTICRDFREELTTNTLENCNAV